MEEHLAPSTQLSELEQSQPIELLIVIGGNEAKLAELEQQVASLQRKAAESFRCQDAKLLRTQLAEARAEADAHSKRLELQQEQLDQAHAAVSQLQGRLGLATDCMVPMLADAGRSSPGSL
jgi:chromosome segregation ATPase